MKRAAGMLGLATLMAAACGDPAPPAAQPIRPLAAGQPAGNAVRIADFVRQQCVEQKRTKTEFEAGLRESGWATREMLINDNSRRGLVGTYEFTGGFISASFDGRSSSCFMSVDAPRAAPFEPLRDALSQFGGRPMAGREPGTVRWQWSGPPGYRYSMDLAIGSESDEGRIRISIFVTGPAR
jgi:hypothetical protein